MDQTFELRSEKKGRWLKCISSDGTVRGMAIQATDLLKGMAARHQLHGRGAKGLGEAVMSALLIAGYCKEGERINLNIQAKGVLSQAVIDAYPRGAVRGYLTERTAPLPDLDPAVTGPWGSGLLSVLRTRDKVGESPFIGTVPLITGHLAKDLAFYWHQSEQVPSAVGLAVNLKDHEIGSAGAFLIQAMPGATDAMLKKITSQIVSSGDFAAEIADHTEPVSVLSRIFQDVGFSKLEEKALEFRCNCSRERVTRALALLGKEELSEMAGEGKHAEVKCDFCNTEYQLSPGELEKLIASGD